MNAIRVTRTVARGATVVLMGAAVLIATGDGFAQSYAGLLGWAHEHRLHGWRADSFPLLVDLFVAIGEMGLFLLAIDGYKLTRRRALSWLDLALPAATATAGWGVSLAFNVGRIRGGTLADQVTAAVAPVAAMVGLLILLRTLHRYVNRPDTVSDTVFDTSEASDDAGQGTDHSLASAVRSAVSAGWTKSAVAEEYGVTRYRLGQLLADTPIDTPAALNGSSSNSGEATEGD
jgi:hypothetical protein